MLGKTSAQDKPLKETLGYKLRLKNNLKNLDFKPWN